MTLHSSRRRIALLAVGVGVIGLHVGSATFLTTSPENHRNPSDLRPSASWTDAASSRYSARQNLALESTTTVRRDKKKGSRASQQSTQGAIVPPPYQTNLIISELAAKASYNASCASQAETLLRSLTNPDTVSYNGVLKAYAKAGNPERAEAILREMRHTTDIAAAAKADVWSYSTVMDAWSRRGNESAAIRAHALLLELQDLYDVSQDPKCRPNTVVYNTVLSAYAKSGGGESAAEKAQALLQDMTINSIADVISFNTVLLAWARSGIPEAGERGEALLRQMMAMTAKDERNLQPNAISYSTVLDAWSKCAREVGGAAVRASRLLEEMECHPSIRPNSVSYSTVIHAYALSREPDKAERAWELLQRMLYESKNGNPGAAPSVITYNNVLNACATARHTRSSSNTLQPETMVRRLYQELRDHPTLCPDHFTYGTVLKACSNVKCAKPDTPEFVQQVFEECCHDGQVSFGVCYQLRQAATAELYRRLIPAQAYIEETRHFSMKDMPREWTRNVKERRNGGISNNK